MTAVLLDTHLVHWWPAEPERLSARAARAVAGADELAAQLRTLPVTPIADTAAALPKRFPGDPADRLIHATALEHGIPLVTKDRRLRGAVRGVPPACGDRPARPAGSRPGGRAPPSTVPVNNRPRSPPLPYDLGL